MRRPAWVRGCPPKSQLGASSSRNFSDVFRHASGCFPQWSPEQVDTGGLLHAIRHPVTIGKYSLWVLRRHHAQRPPRSSCISSSIIGFLSFLVIGNQISLEAKGNEDDDHQNYDRNGLLHLDSRPLFWKPSHLTY